MSDEELIQLANSRAYTVFGFGSDPNDFAKRLLELKQKNIQHFEQLWDVVNRFTFVDLLKFEVGWEAERKPGLGKFGFEGNLDSLEIYLLCTCIDTLAGRQPYESFPDWVRQNQEQVKSANPDENGFSPELYTKTTEKLWKTYEDSYGLSRNFVALFLTLPDFLKQTIADTFIFVKGAEWHDAFRDRYAKWEASTVDEKVKKFAKDYLYALRRSEYTHSSRSYDVAKPGWLRRATESRDIDRKGDENRWTTTRFWDDKQEARYSLFVPVSTDEAFLLRAIITIWIRLNLLGYAADNTYLDKLLKYYQALSAIYAFLNEMQRNRDSLEYLLTIAPQAITLDRELHYAPLYASSTKVGEGLIKEFREFVIDLENEIAAYLHRLAELHNRVEEFNKAYPPRSDDSIRQKAVIEFSQELSKWHVVGDLRNHHQWVSNNLRQHVEKGYILYRFAVASAS